MSTAKVDPVVAQLADRRRDMKLSASQVALMLGMGASAISQFESGHREPNPRVLRRWAGALGMELTLTPIDGAA